MIQAINSPLEKLLLTPRQTAESLQISERQLWRLEKAGEIKSARIGKRIVRFSPDALRAFIGRLAEQRAVGNGEGGGNE
ncbi:MAG: helix-turn-helix domain-containing protein [Thermoguttaceae bacterium]|jgi:excisionase family DNA binding protein